jgi:hypothetical protein
MSSRSIPFPMRFAERVASVAVEGSYDHSTQTNRLRGGMVSRATTQQETGTGGHNDTDQDWDQD